MARAKSTMTTEELYDVLYAVTQDGDSLQFRSRRSKSERAWQNAPEGHAINTAVNEYRSKETRFWLEGDYVMCGDGSLPVADARKLLALVKRHKRATFGEYSSDLSTDYAVIVRKNGDVTVGCQDFTAEEVRDVATLLGVKL